MNAAAVAVKTLGAPGAGSMAFEICHVDDVPRLRGHLPLVTAAWLYARLGDEGLLAEIPCPGCGVLPVRTPEGLCGMEPEEWERYCRIREAGRRGDLVWQRRNGKWRAAGERLEREEVGR